MDANKSAKEIVEKLLEDENEGRFDMAGDSAADDELTAILMDHFGVSTADDIDDSDPEGETRELWNWAHEAINSLHPLAGGKSPQEVLDTLDGVSMGLGSNIGLEILSALKPRIVRGGQWIPYTAAP